MSFTQSNKFTPRRFLDRGHPISGLTGSQRSNHLWRMAEAVVVFYESVYRRYPGSNCRVLLVRPCLVRWVLPERRAG